MQLYHHPLSLDSQKVRIALEENSIDYTSYHVNPLTGKNFDPWFFRMNPSGKLPVFQNGSTIIYDTIEIIQYIERIAAVSSGIDHHNNTNNNLSNNNTRVLDWMRKIQDWNPKYFTLSHVHEKHRVRVSKFLRRVIIARMSESPDLASSYHLRLKDAYDVDEKMKDGEEIRRSEEHLVRLLDEVEAQLKDSSYLVGGEFSMADAMLIPVLTRLMVLKLEDEYLSGRPNIVEYWNMVKERPSFKKVIGRYFSGWKRQMTLMKSWCFINFRSLLRRY